MNKEFQEHVEYLKEMFKSRDDYKEYDYKCEDYLHFSVTYIFEDKVEKRRFRYEVQSNHGKVSLTLRIQNIKARHNNKCINFFAEGEDMKVLIDKYKSFEELIQTYGMKAS